jgi:hypothetical protein
LDVLIEEFSCGIIEFAAGDRFGIDAVAQSPYSKCIAIAFAIA